MGYFDLSTVSGAPPSPPLTPNLDAVLLLQPAPAPKKLRILCLHGFGQNDDFFRIKMRRLQAQIESSLQAQHPAGIEFIYPSGPVSLTNDATREEATSYTDMRAWWRVLNNVSQYDELCSTLHTLLAEVDLSTNSIDGVIGFSQGAALAMMLASLCEGTAERRDALSAQGAPIHLPPPQAPLKFVVACSGFAGTPEYYTGFYEPNIATPSMHVIADYDIMVSEEGTTRLLKLCSDTTVVRFRGGHHLPTMSADLAKIARFIGDACAPARNFDVDDAAEVVAIPGISSNGLLTPPSDESMQRLVKSRTRHQYRRVRRVSRTHCGV